MTFFWVLSDFISGRSETFSLSPDLIKAKDEQTLIKMASGGDVSTSNAALWMVLLQRLTAVTTDQRIELRNSKYMNSKKKTMLTFLGAIQTLLRIFDAYGDHLGPEAWSLCLQSVIFRLLASTEEQLESTNDPESGASVKEKNEWNETAILVLSGISNLLAEYLDSISSHATFKSSWRALLSQFKRMLDLKVPELSTAVFKSVRHILSNANRDEKINIDSASISLAWELWSDSMPTINQNNDDKNFDNQKYLLAYVSALQEVYRLIYDEIDAERVQILLKLLQEATRTATAGVYTADIENLTSLQAKILETFKMIRTDIEGIPAAIICQAAEFIGLAFEEQTDSGPRKPTYIALSKAFMVLSESLVVSHASAHDIYNSGAVSSALNALAKPIVLKYNFATSTKSMTPWRQATISVLAILKAILPTLIQPEVEDNPTKSIWSSIVMIANGITTAELQDVTTSVNIKEDEEFDIATFKEIRNLIIPALGSPIIPDKTRRLFTESLFHRSLIHAPQPNELPQLDQELLANLYKVRRGRTIDPAPSKRKQMSYVCLDELISLVAVNNSTKAQIKLAQAAAPYLILRAGLTLQTYIADQPLRGLMPQPLSQRVELLYILKALVKLRCEPEAIPDAPGVESEGKKHLHRLYPLIAKATRVAAKDQEALEWLGKVLDEVGIEFGVGA